MSLIHSEVAEERSVLCSQIWHEHVIFTFHGPQQMYFWHKGSPLPPTFLQQSIKSQKLGSYCHCLQNYDFQQEFCLLSGAQQWRQASQCHSRISWKNSATIPHEPFHSQHAEDSTLWQSFFHVSCPAHFLQKMWYMNTAQILLQKKIFLQLQNAECCSIPQLYMKSPRDQLHSVWIQLDWAPMPELAIPPTLRQSCAAGWLFWFIATPIHFGRCQVGVVVCCTLGYPLCEMVFFQAGNITFFCIILFVLEKYNTHVFQKQFHCTNLEVDHPVLQLILLFVSQGQCRFWHNQSTNHFNSKQNETKHAMLWQMLSLATSRSNCSFPFWMNNTFYAMKIWGCLTKGWKLVLLP